MQVQDIQSTAGYQLPFFWFEHPEARANIILMAALGVPAGFYKALAESLCRKKLNVMLLEQRGHGESALRASRTVDFGFREALVEDLPAAFEWLERKTGFNKQICMGHSLGGHYSLMLTALYPDKVQGVVIVACGTPWVKAFQGKTRWLLRLLCFLLPIFYVLPGYYPGHRLGFGGREARSLMYDWLQMAKDNRYIASGLSVDLDKGIGKYSGKVLGVRIADDDFAPKAAMEAVLDKCQSAEVSRVELGQEDIGDRADHFRWARKPEAVSSCVSDWIGQMNDGREQ